jgi:polyisoprenoid-binding protein YceI
MANWNLEPGHTSVTFSARHMMLSTVRGTMRNVTGTVVYDPANPAAASVEARIPTDNFETGLGDRDNHLKSPDFLNSAEFPFITFKSTRVEPTGESTARVHGDLTIRDVTRPVVLDAEFIGLAAPPWGGPQAAGFQATTRINREDWGLTWNVALEAGGWLVGKEIRIEIDAEAVPAQQEAPAATA